MNLKAACEAGTEAGALAQGARLMSPAGHDAKQAKLFVEFAIEGYVGSAALWSFL